jgi:hypothetical protein
MVLFASGVLCILIATLRAANVTAHTIRTGKTMDGTWLAVWSMAETSVGMPPTSHRALSAQLDRVAQH